jgi:hypothetical protein
MYGFILRLLVAEIYILIILTRFYVKMLPLLLVCESQQVIELSQAASKLLHLD